jgi:hypothetical protein
LRAAVLDAVRTRNAKIAMLQEKRRGLQERAKENLQFLGILSQLDRW